MDVSSGAGRVAFVGTFPPRKCGIATFTNDLCQAVRNAGVEPIVIPMNDRAEGYEYADPVRFTIFEPDLSTYRRAAEYLNINRVDVVSLQHEYGIFGGNWGSHVLAFLQALRTPVVSTFHTVRREPDEDEKRVLQEVAALSDRIVVIGEHARTFLHEVYDVPKEKVDLIPHGIPDFPFVDPNYYKDQFDVAGRPVLLTFGLLAPHKGLEYVIQALPKIKQAVPDVVYLIVGATHPYWIRREGEAYRLRLHRLARELDVTDNVVFHNRFVDDEELVAFLGAADIFITPYLSVDQVSSGTLSWAIGAGKAAISTPYWYAREVLADDRGILVPFGEHEPIADAVIKLLTDQAFFHGMRKRAYTYGRHMTWTNVGHMYKDAFNRVLKERTRRPRRFLVHRPEPQRPRGELPSLRLRHLRRLTDDVGVLQHAFYTVPRYSHGYTVMDNALALLLTMRIHELGELEEDETEDLATRYLGFLLYAFDGKSGRFRDELRHGETVWGKTTGSEESHGCALWALAATVARSPHAALRDMAGKLFEQALRAAAGFSSLSGCALTLLGLHDYLSWFSGDVTARDMRHRLAAELLRRYRRAADDEWRWFDETLTRWNARAPHALIVAGQGLSDEDLVTTGLAALEWLCRVHRPDGGDFVPVGSNGFYARGKERARFDQHPHEACAAVAACLAAYELTGEQRWYREAEATFEWFLGRNDHRVPLYDPRTGGCHDGLHPDGMNANQGARATLSYLLSLADMRLADKAIVLKRGESRVERIGELSKQPS